MNLKPLVNDKVLWTDFLQELDNRIGQAHKALEQSTDTSAMFRLQGQIESLRKLKQLREKVNNGQ